MITTTLNRYILYSNYHPKINEITVLPLKEFEDISLEAIAKMINIAGTSKGTYCKHLELDEKITNFREIVYITGFNLLMDTIEVVIEIRLEENNTIEYRIPFSEWAMNDIFQKEFKVTFLDGMVDFARVTISKDQKLEAYRSLVLTYLRKKSNTKNKK